MTCIKLDWGMNVNLMKDFFFDLSQLAVSIMTDQIYYEKYMAFEICKWTDNWFNSRYSYRLVKNCKAWTKKKLSRYSKFKYNPFEKQSELKKIKLTKKDSICEQQYFPQQIAWRSITNQTNRHPTLAGSEKNNLGCFPQIIATIVCR